MKTDKKNKGFLAKLESEIQEEYLEKYREKIKAKIREIRMTEIILGRQREELSALLYKNKKITEEELLFLPEK